MKLFILYKIYKIQSNCFNPWAVTKIRIFKKNYNYPYIKKIWPSTQEANPIGSMCHSSPIFRKHISMSFVFVWTIAIQIYAKLSHAFPQKLIKLIIDIDTFEFRRHFSRSSKIFLVFSIIF
jgi:hypothetical protein